MIISFRPIRFLLAVALAFFLAGAFGAGEAASQSPALGGETLNVLDSKLHRDISLDLRDMDVVDVYRFLALRGDFNTSISKNISGRVTLYLRDVTIRDALDIISISNDLAYKIIGDNIIHVMTESEFLHIYGKRFSDRREVKILRLNYVKPAYAQETLRNLQSDLGRIVIDEDTGSIVLIDVPSNIERMERVVREMDRGLELQIFDIQYADVEEVAAQLRREIDNKSVGSTQADIRSNQIIVRAYPERLSEIEKMIAALDRKTNAVLIELRILRLSLNPGMQRGIDWRRLMNTMSNIALGGVSPGGAAIKHFSGGDLGLISLGSIGADTLTVQLDMLDEVTSTKVLANPSLLVTENEEASIHIGDKLAYTTSTIIGTGDSMRTQEEVHFIQVGVEFVVSAKINQEGFVTMKISPEISSQTDELVTKEGSVIPIINTTHMSTEVIVRDKHTIIMAGLKQDEQRQSEVGVSGLKDLPLIGRLFTRKTEDGTMTEIAILITPHIVSGTENYADQEYDMKEIRMDLKEYDKL